MEARSDLAKRAGVLRCYDRLDYATAWRLQRQLVEERGHDRRPDTLLLLEHEPVFTVGRRGQRTREWGDEEALRKAGYPVHHVERGGSVTYHGPGQLVGYPILRLNQFCSGPKVYMRLLEEVVIRTLARWGLTGRRIEAWPGVWVGEALEPPQKIAAMGVRLVRGITMHGFALNVSVDVAPFDRIVPCGIAGCRVTSMAAHLGEPIESAAVRRRLTEEFAHVFGLDWIEEGRSGEALPMPALSGVGRDLREEAV
jgi:lipoyl(octanoyl) transferase